MPTYDYQCRSCGTVIELIHSMAESGPTTCELCGGDLRRVLYPTGIIFKGSGFYRNDSRRGRDGSASPASPSASGSETPPESSPKTDGPPKAAPGGAPASDSGAKSSTSQES